MRIHWVLAICVVCHYEQPCGEHHRKTCAGCSAQLRFFVLYRDLQASHDCAAASGLASACAHRRCGRSPLQDAQLDHPLTSAFGESPPASRPLRGTVTKATVVIGPFRDRMKGSQARLSANVTRRGVDTREGPRATSRERPAPRAGDSRGPGASGRPDGVGRPAGGPGSSRAALCRRPAPDGSAARRAPRRAGDLPQPMGRHRGAAGGAGTAFVGSHEQIADLMCEYHELGITEFVLSGYPHVEEAYAFGEGVIPILRRGSSASRLRSDRPALSVEPTSGFELLGSDLSARVSWHRRHPVPRSAPRADPPKTSRAAWSRSTAAHW
jgi:hypothetical protein